MIKIKYEAMLTPKEMELYSKFLMDLQALREAAVTVTVKPEFDWQSPVVVI